MAVLWENCARGENCAHGARVLRMLGDTPCPVVPDTVDGLPVVEIGPYCFADRAVTGGALWPADSADTHEVTGNFVQEVTLPDTVRVIDSAAFYNCRKLRWAKRPTALAVTCLPTAAVWKCWSCTPVPARQRGCAGCWWPSART